VQVAAAPAAHGPAVALFSILTKDLVILSEAHFSGVEGGCPLGAVAFSPDLLNLNAAHPLQPHPLEQNRHQALNASSGNRTYMNAPALPNPICHSNSIRSPALLHHPGILPEPDMGKHSSCEMEVAPP
jgi:hypothetical protein